MTPSQQHVTIIAVKVDEYRNGVLIGSVVRDIQITVLSCTEPPPFLTGIDTNAAVDSDPSGGIANHNFCADGFSPVIFNINAKNYFIGTFLGILPSVFILSSFASGLSEALFKFEKFPSLISLLVLPEIYFPIIGFIIILLISLILKKKISNK